MIEPLIDQIEHRWAEAEQLMADPEVIGDRHRYAEAARTYRQLEPAARLAEQWRRARGDVDGARELLAEGEGEGDEARELLQSSQEELERLEEELRLAMVEPDPNDDKN